MKWTVGSKLGLGFGLALGVFVIVGMVSFFGTRELIDASDWRDHTYQVMADLDETLSSLTDAETAQRGYLLTGKEPFLAPYQADLGRVTELIQDLRRLVADNPQQGQRLDELEPIIRNHTALTQQAIDARRTNSLEAAVAIIENGQASVAFDAVRKTIAGMQETETELLKRRSETSHASALHAQWAIVAGTTLAALIAALTGWMIAGNVARPLRDLTTVADRITVGDLTARVALLNGRADEVALLSVSFDRMTGSLRTMAAAAEKIAAGDLRATVKPQSAEDVLGQSFVRMTENLRQQIGGMVESANVLSSAAGEIVASTAQLASTATQSATAVSETTTTVAEVRQTAELSSQKSKLVADSAQKAAQTSQAGRRSVEEMTSAIGRIRRQMEAIAASMVRLGEQGQAIGQIIATVEDLAVQSNLLAVNAAIEAARAGEHGQGFGVVAQEVKSLAEQSRQATKQVRALLGEIQKATSAAVMVTEQANKAVEAGEKQTSVASESLQVLTSGVVDAAQAATQIAASSQQQLVGMDQVAAAMESIKQASGQNVASAKQLEAAARNLDDLGRRFKEVVEGYRL